MPPTKYQTSPIKHKEDNFENSNEISTNNQDVVDAVIPESILRDATNIMSQTSQMSPSNNVDDGYDNMEQEMNDIGIS